MNILVTSVSAKVSLLRSFKESAHTVHITGIDTDPWAPAKRFCDYFFCVPPLDSADFLSEISLICQRQAIELIIPTRAEELYFWSNLQNTGSLPPIAVSSPECIQICEDKRLLATFLRDKKLPAVPTIPIAHFRQQHAPHLAFPLIAKNPTGSGSRGVRLVYCEEELQWLEPNWVLQPQLKGEEYTLNAYVNKNGICQCVTPHRRICVCGGEVDRAITVKDKILIDLGKRIAETLPGAYGPLNVQVFYDSDRKIVQGITDINPRFGGGYVLAHAAGGHFTHWLLEEALGESLPKPNTEWVEGLYLLRYREAFFEQLGK